MEFINLTPHCIQLMDVDNPTILKCVFKPSGKIARINQPWGNTTWIDGIPIIDVGIGKVTNIPDPVEGVTYIVSRLVAERCALFGRTDDIVCPDTSRRSGGVYDGANLVGVRKLCRIKDF